MRILVGGTRSISSGAEVMFGKVYTSPMAESRLVPEWCLDLLAPGELSRFGEHEGEFCLELVTTFLTLGFLFELFLGRAIVSTGGGDSEGVGGLGGEHCREERASVSLADSSTGGPSCTPHIRLISKRTAWNSVCNILSRSPCSCVRRASSRTETWMKSGSCHGQVSAKS